MDKEPHIGKLIKRHINNKGIRIGWLADKLGFHRNNVYKIFERPWIDTQTLMKISLILEYDFFSELSKYYKNNVKTVDSTKFTQNAH